MKETIFLNKELESLFLSGDPFEVAGEIKGKIFRKTANRITKEFSFKGNNYFIKLHYGIGWKEIVKNLLKLRMPTIGAFPEWKALKKLKSLGIDCPEPVGFYSKGINPAKSKSFLVTKSLLETISLEEALQKGKFQELNFPIKKRFIEKVALISRNLHKNGINHRDYYLCHFHVDKNMDIEKEISLIDLHRAQLRSFVPARWASKDIGGLFHSAMGFKLNERDFYRFIKTYFQCSLKEALETHSRFIQTSRERAFRMFMKPILKEINLSFSEIQKDTSEYLGRNEDNLRWIAKKKYLSKNLRKFFSQTRAFTAWKASHWFNAAGIKTFNIVAVIERYNSLTTTESYLISLNQPGERLDEVDLNKQKEHLIENRLSSFFKRLRWIGFNHGDAKSSNFFLFQKELFVFDLDISKKIFLKFRVKNKIIKDQRRLLKSFEEHKKTKDSLIKRF